MIGLLIRSLERKEKIMIYYMDNANKLTQWIVRVVEIDDTREGDLSFLTPIHVLFFSPSLSLICVVNIRFIYSQHKYNT